MKIIPLTLSILITIIIIGGFLWFNLDEPSEDYWDIDNPNLSANWTSMVEPIYFGNITFIPGNVDNLKFINQTCYPVTCECAKEGCMAYCMKCKEIKSEEVKYGNKN